MAGRAELKEVPSDTVIEWYISGGSGGKDGQGVAVRFDWEEGQLVPDSRFTARLKAWECEFHGVDSYSLSERPSLKLLNDLICGAAYFNIETHRIEEKFNLAV